MSKFSSKSPSNKEFFKPLAPSDLPSAYFNRRSKSAKLQASDEDQKLVQNDLQSSSAPMSSTRGKRPDLIEGSGYDDEKCGRFRPLSAESKSLSGLIKRGIGKIPGSSPLCVLQVSSMYSVPLKSTAYFPELFLRFHFITQHNRFVLCERLPTTPISSHCIAPPIQMSRTIRIVASWRSSCKKRRPLSH